MAELLPQDRLQPSLLDRLIDDEPDKRTEPPEKRLLNLGRLRESVLRDLNWLFNSTQMGHPDTFENAPQVATSVINFGLPAFSGMCASGIDPKVMEQELRKAILDFEPRLLPESVRVRAKMVDHVENQHNKLSFDIECRLWAQPAPIALLLHSDVDLESGQNAVKESGRR